MARKFATVEQARDFWENHCGDGRTGFTVETQQDLDIWNEMMRQFDEELGPGMAHFYPFVSVAAELEQ